MTPLFKETDFIQTDQCDASIMFIFVKIRVCSTFYGEPISVFPISMNKPFLFSCTSPSVRFYSNLG